MEDSEEGVMVQHNHATNGSLDADLNERMEDERPNHTMIGSLMDDERKGLSHKNNNCLKVPKCEIFDRSDFHYFYTIKPFWVDDFVVKILNYYFNFWGSQASFSF